MELLSKETFIAKVFDFEKEADWKFIGELPCIIDFYADWCEPCKIVAPVLEELSKEYEGRVNVFKVDTEAEHELAGVFGIQSIPTILFIPMIGEPHIMKGAMPKATFIQVIEDILFA